ncbi:MAG: glycosyltransferase [Methanobacterium sp.]|nr:glycosyltransferase [Methanobacterium sp.]
MLWIVLFFMLIIGSIKTVNSSKMSVSVIIPAFNEDKTVGNVVKTVKKLSYIDEIIVVDDGSYDNTASVAENAGATVIQHTKNRGKGAAIKTGFNNSKGDIIVFFDADIENLTPKQVDNVIKPIINGEADITKTKFKREAGRVTELTAKPLLNFFFPEIKFDQPLSGQFAAKRSFLNKIKLEDDYGVDVGIVLDADVRGLRIKEVDIGKIHHVLSPLNELNMVATEVVRTIVQRATEYGRVAMIDSLGRSIRMEILGLSMVFLGIFSTFFIRPVPVELGLLISIAGAVVAIYYLVKIIRISYNMLRKPEGRIQTLKSFFYMHSPILVSAIILLAMISTLLGAVQFQDGKVSIEPTSRNLIIWGPNQENKSIDLRGPYTVDSALENETSLIRMPKEAMDSLGLAYGDIIYINNTNYSLNQTVPGEDNVMRIPADIRSYLGLNIRDVIRDSDVRNIFKNLYAEKTVPVQNYANLTLKEGIIIKTGSDMGRIVNIYIDDQKVASTSGIFKNGTYDVYVNGVKYTSIYFDDQNPKSNNYLYVGDKLIKIEIADEIRSDMIFATVNEGWFLSFIFNGTS